MLTHHLVSIIIIINHPHDDKEMFLGKIMFDSNSYDNSNDCHHSDYYIYEDDENETNYETNYHFHDGDQLHYHQR